MSGKTAGMPLAEHFSMIVDGILASCQYIRGQRRIPSRLCQSEIADRTAAHAVLLDFKNQFLTLLERLQTGFRNNLRVNENRNAASVG